MEPATPGTGGRVQLQKLNGYSSSHSIFVLQEVIPFVSYHISLLQAKERAYRISIASPKEKKR